MIDRLVVNRGHLYSSLRWLNSKTPKHLTFTLIMADRIFEPWIHHSKKSNQFHIYRNRRQKSIILFFRIQNTSCQSIFFTRHQRGYSRGSIRLNLDKAKNWIDFRGNDGILVVKLISNNTLHIFCIIYFYWTTLFLYSRKMGKKNKSESSVAWFLSSLKTVPENKALMPIAT